MKASVSQIVQTSAAVYALGGAAVAMWGALAGKTGLIQAGALMAALGAAVGLAMLILTPPTRR